MHPRLCGWVVVLAACLSWSTVFARGTTAERVFARLQRGKYLDTYGQAMTADVAANLINAANRWSGVQVNDHPHAGAVTIFLIDADRLPAANILRAEGLNLSREGFRRDAITDEASTTIFIDTGLLKEIAASTFLTLAKEVVSVTTAVAMVRVQGLGLLRRTWDPTAQAGMDPKTVEGVNLLMQGVLAFIIAHELGHVALGRPTLGKTISSGRKLTARQYDELAACPELLVAEFEQRQEVERRADAFAAGLLALQCTGAGGPLRHETYMLGANWYFLFVMSQKLLAGARVTESPAIRAMMTRLIGPQLYDAVVDRADQRSGRAVHEFLPPSHPPDIARLRQLEANTGGPPCGGAGLRQDGPMAAFQEELARNCALLKTSAERP